MKKLLLSLVLLAVPALAEDYQCGSDAGCEARIVEDGELHEVMFRKGDMVSTDAGWSVSTDDGWVKVKTPKAYRPPHPLAQRPMQLCYFVGFYAVQTGALTPSVPTFHGSFARPVSISLIGL